MTNKEFLLEVQKSCHIEMPRCLMLMGCLRKMLGNAAVDQVPVVLLGLGVFTSHKHPEYVQEDPQTGAMTLYPPRITYHLQSEQNTEGTLCAELLSEYAHVEQEEAASFVNAVIDVVNDHLQAGEEIEVPGIGAFKNVLTHQSDLKHIDFLPCDQMKELVNAPFACFEPYEISAGAVIEKDEPAKEENVEETVVEENVEETTEEENFEETAEEEKVEVTSMEEPAIVSEPVSDAAIVLEPEEKETTELPDPETSDAVEDAEEPAPAPNISYHSDGHIMIKQEEKKSDDDSTKKVLYISLALIMSACGFLLWLILGDGFLFHEDPPTEAKVIEAAPPKTTPIKIEPVKEEVIEEEPIPEKKIPEANIPEEKVTETQIPEEKIAKVQKPSPAHEFHRMKGADGKELTVKLEAGSRLTLIALEHFGDKSFWPYIFDVNTDKLKAPNLVQSGMVLYLPDPEYYGIDAQDPASVRKAKNRAAQLLK